ncbi:hypothetical protein WNY78_03055 [Psychroserpens sp. AS72]|uniref:hypothetical protein n=1 Tax=Psychroserpens sp. AS72 TaxID=3135775 RepID=UPI00316B6CF1
MIWALPNLEVIASSSSSSISINSVHSRDVSSFRFYEIVTENGHGLRLFGSLLSFSEVQLKTNKSSVKM